MVNLRSNKENHIQGNDLLSITQDSTINIKSDILTHMEKGKGK